MLLDSVEIGPGVQLGFNLSWHSKNQQSPTLPISSSPTFNADASSMEKSPFKKAHEAWR